VSGEGRCWNDVIAESFCVALETAPVPDRP
jgi:hypothetical protein